MMQLNRRAGATILHATRLTLGKTRILDWKR